MTVGYDGIVRLCALTIGVGRYLADIDAGYTPDDGALRKLNKMAQGASFGDLQPYAKDAIDLADQVRESDNDDEWAELTGRD